MWYQMIMRLIWYEANLANPDIIDAIDAAPCAEKKQLTT